MHGSKTKVASTRTTSADEVTAEVAAEYGPLVRRLVVEFSAPVGLLDPTRGTWVARVGAPPEVFPRLGPGLTAAASAHGKAVVCRNDDSGPAVWLLVPASCEAGSFVAAAGFAASHGPASSSVRWGPHCPEPALRAWGQSVADQLRPSAEPASASASALSSSSSSASASASSTAPARGGADAAPRAPSEGAERQIVARLIRRLRISDPPERFQQMATNALRTTLGVESVAWVPCHHSDPVIVNGNVGRLKADGYRTLIPGPHQKETSVVVNDPATTVDPALRRVVCASADSQGSVGCLIAVNTNNGRPFDVSDAELLQTVASMIASQQINARVYADLKELLFGVIRALTAAIDAKDPYTSGHSERVARIAVRLAEELGMSPNQRGDLYLMGLLHDVGKIGVDDAVLKKPGPLTPDEYRQIQAHVEIGVHILSDLKKLHHLLPGVRHHHESLDGSGYPCGLAGDAIPLEARILAVADSYDAMSSTRPYRRRITPTQIDEILRKGSNVQWDPKVIDALFACRMDLEMIRQKGLGESLQLAISETLGRT